MTNVIELPASLRPGLPTEAPNCQRENTANELESIARFVVGKSRSDIGRLRDAKQTEIRVLEARIAERRGLPDGDNFPAKRDARQISQIQREIAFLTDLFDRPVV